MDSSWCYGNSVDEGISCSSKPPPLASQCYLIFTNGFFVQDMPALNNMTIKVCYPFPEEWGPNYPKVIVLFRFACFYAVPLFIIGIFYVLIAKHLIYSASHVPGEIQGAQRQVINRTLCQLLSYRHGISTRQTQLGKSCQRCSCQRFPGNFYPA